MKFFMVVSFQVSDGVEVSCAILGDPVISSSYLLTNHDVSFAIFSLKHGNNISHSRMLAQTG